MNLVGVTGVSDKFHRQSLDMDLIFLLKIFDKTCLKIRIFSTRVECNRGYRKTAA